jgi:biotin carboxylase
MKTILFLSGGSLVAQSMLATLEGRREHLRIVATTSASDDVGLWTYERVVKVPETAKHPDAFHQSIQKILDSEPIDLIIPCRDDDIVALARMARDDVRVRAVAITGPLEVAQRMADKWHSYELANENGLPFAKSYIHTEGGDWQAFADEVGYPLIAKPRDGFSSKGVYLIEEASQFQRALLRANYVFEEYLDDPAAYWAFKESLRRDGMPLFYTLHGLKHSLQLLFDSDSHFVRGYATYNKQAMQARTLKMNHEDATLQLVELCGRVFSKLGWRGPLNIQCQLDKRGKVTIHEFNGRFSGPTAERWLLGYDDVALAIKLFTGLELPASTWTDNPALHTTARIFARGADPRNVAILEEQGEWSPPTRARR